MAATSRSWQRLKTCALILPLPAAVCRCHCAVSAADQLNCHPLYLLRIAEKRKTVATWLRPPKCPRPWTKSSRNKRSPTTMVSHLRRACVGIHRWLFEPPLHQMPVMSSNVLLRIMRRRRPAEDVADVPVVELGCEVGQWVITRVGIAQVGKRLLHVREDLIKLGLQSIAGGD